MPRKDDNGWDFNIVAAASMRPGLLCPGSRPVVAVLPAIARLQ